MTEEMDATGRQHLLEVNEKPPYFVGILDDVVQIGVDEAGEPRAIIEATHPEVRVWAERTTPVEATASVDESATGESTVE